MNMKGGIYAKTEAYRVSYCRERGRIVTFKDVEKDKRLARRVTKLKESTQKVVVNYYNF